MKNEINSEFENRIKQRFDESVTTLDASTLSRLTTLRNQVLDNAGESASGRSLWVPMGAFATICTAIVIYSLIPHENVENKTFVDEIDIISELELYENLDFYEWLKQHELPS
jgi:hypothetical protein